MVNVNLNILEQSKSEIESEIANREVKEYRGMHIMGVYCEKCNGSIGDLSVFTFDRRNRKWMALENNLNWNIKFQIRENGDVFCEPECGQKLGKKQAMN